MVEVNNSSEIPYSTFNALKSFLHVYISACKCQSTDIYCWFSWNSTAVLHPSHSSHARTPNAVRKPLPPRCKCAFFLSGWKVDPLQTADNVSSPLLLCSARVAADADKHHVRPIKALADSSDTPFTARSSPVSGVVPPCGIPSPNLQVHAVVVLKARRASNAVFFCFRFFVCVFWLCRR